MRRALQVLVVDRRLDHPSQLIPHRPDVGVVGTEKSEVVAVFERPAILLGQHLDSARCAQDPVDHPVFDPVRSAEQAWRRRVLQLRPPGPRGDGLVGASVAERALVADHLASVTCTASGARLGRRPAMA